MKQSVEDEAELRGYLLGSLTPEEHLRIEERLFLEHEYFQQLPGAEEELIDDYLAGELSESDQQRFRAFFLSKPEQYEALRIATALRKYIKANAGVAATTVAASVSEIATPPPSPAPAKIPFLQRLRLNHPTLRLSLVAALLLIALGGVWLAVKLLRRPGDSSPVQAGRQLKQEDEKQSQQSQRDVQQEPNDNSPANVHDGPPQYAEQLDQPRTGREHNTGPANDRGPNKQTREPEPSNRKLALEFPFTLSPVGAVRGEGGVDVLPLPPGYSSVKLKIPFNAITDYRSYQVTLKDSNDRTYLTRSGLPAATARSGKIIYLKVPAQLLTPQQYRVELRGTTANGDVRMVGAYSFQVAKK